MASTLEKEETETPTISPSSTDDDIGIDNSLLVTQGGRRRSTLTWSQGGSRRSTLTWSERRRSSFSWSEWLWHVTLEDCCNFTRYPSDAFEGGKAPEPVSVPHFLGFFFSKLLLEVCGAAGAVWGFCEIIQWRRVENTDDFRPFVTLTFCVFAVRFYWHAKHFWQYGYDFPYVKLHHRRSHWYHGLQVFGSKFLLQVWGAAGAVWGASETLGLRHHRNRQQWLLAAWITTAVFGLRWCIALFRYCLIPCNRRTKRMSVAYRALQTRIVPFVEVTITKFILEVCGSTGATWGFADILTIRDQTPDSAEFWRITALIVGSIFLVRWMQHVKDYLHLGEESPLATEPPQVELEGTESLDEEDEDDEESGILAASGGTYGSTAATIVIV